MAGSPKASSKASSEKSSALGPRPESAKRNPERDTGKKGKYSSADFGTMPSVEKIRPMVAFDTTAVSIRKVSSKKSMGAERNRKVSAIYKKSKDRLLNGMPPRSMSFGKDKGCGAG